MNATARICEACKRYDTEILVAEGLYRDFNSPNFDFEIIMNAELRGKVERMNLVKLQPVLIES
jgi:class 3 adenylate cyclase